MITPIWVTSFLHQAVTATNGGGIFTGVAGTPTFGNTTPRASGGYLVCAPAAAALNVAIGAITADIAVYSFYFRLPSLPARSLLAIFVSTAGADAYFGYDAPSTKFYAQVSGGVEQKLTGITPTANVWYRLDVRYTCSINPRTLDWQVAVDDGSAAIVGTQCVGAAEAVSTNSKLRLGSDSSSYTYTCNYADVIMSVTPGDYPIGAHDTVLLTPNADGTHNAGTNTMEDDVGTDIGSTTAYDKINSVASGLPSSTTYIRQATANTGAYIEVEMSDMSLAKTPIGIMGTIAYTSATTTANQMAAGAYDGSTFYEIWGNPATRKDYSDGSTANLYYKSAILSLDNLTCSNVNALKFRAGYSNDVSPNPYLIDAWFECAYITTAAPVSNFREQAFAPLLVR